MAKKRKHGGGSKRGGKAATRTKGSPAASAKSTTAIVDDNAEATDDTAKAPASDESPGQRRRREARIERAARGRSAAAVSALGAADAPSFWFGFDVSWAKLVLGRVLVFSLLAIDALMQISHAPRYGAGGFNVAHIPLLDSLGPSRITYSIGQLVCAYLFVLVACGVATRVVLPIATAIYGWLYFGSHLDSYQHHYLVWLVLLLACFVPWERPANATPSTRVRSWALRLILVQLALLYLWAAISKINPAWLDGRTLAGQITGGVRSLIDSTIGIKLASRMVMLVELFLAVTIWMPRAWRFAAPIGLALHIGILKSGLEIGLFAWLMIGIYVFIVPDRIWVWIAELSPLESLRRIARRIAGWFDGWARWLVWIVAAGGGIALALVTRFHDAKLVGIALLAVLFLTTVLALVRRRINIAWLAVAHLLAFVMWIAVDRTESVASDYYRLWGGSSIRLGNPKTAEYAYRRMTEVAPRKAQGFYQLGKLLLGRGADAEGLAALHAAQGMESDKARAYVAEARWLMTKGRRDEALVSVNAALAAEPNDPDARSLLETLKSPQ